MSWTVMSLLLVFNAALLLFSMVAQRLYIQYRDWHCVTSLVLHRVANLLAYFSFSAHSIGSAAALLDGSSFPQVLLLCIGAKGRVKYMLPALLVTAGLSMPTNGDLCAAAFPNWTPIAKCEFSMRVLQTCCGFLLPAAVIVLMERRCRYSFLRSLSSK